MPPERFDDLPTLIFAVQHTHCSQHHMGVMRVYVDCALCLALKRLDNAARAASPPAAAGGPAPALPPRPRP